MSALILGIETSCDETSVAVVRDGRDVLSNVIASSMHFHKKYGGVIPEIACRHHTEIINIVFKKALDAAGVSLKDINAIGVTKGPGLVGALLVGISMAKAISYSAKLPLVAVNHLHGHIYSAMMHKEQPALPAVGLIVSGGHSSLIYMRDVNTIELLGQTRDDACGEAFDKVAKILGLGFPGGPVVEKNAARARGEAVKFPRSYLEKDSLDYSFSGIKTSVLYRAEDFKKNRKRVPVNEICAGFQDAMFDMLINKTIAACKKMKTKILLVGGGVSANSTLRDRLSKACACENVKIYFPPKGMSTDNAAMIAGVAYHLYKKGKVSDYGFQAEPDLNF